MKFLTFVLLCLAFAPDVFALASEDNATNPYDVGLRGTPESRRRAQAAHALVAIFSVVVLLPLGAILLRLIKKSSRAVHVHWIFQLISLSALIWGFGLGLWTSYLKNNVRFNSCTK